MKMASSSSSSSSSSSLCIFFVNVAIGSCLVQLSSAFEGKNKSIAAVFSFGDSILDTGNNNMLDTFTKCNFPPYGRDFKDGVATGRFSNGKVFTDYITSGLKVKNLLPAYLDPNLKNSDLPTGVGFASGGSGLDTQTAAETAVYSMPSQLHFFSEYLVKLKAAVGEDRAKKIIPNSLFLISAANNDICITYASFKRAVLPFDAYADQLVGLFSSFIKQLYGMGARRFGVMSTLPLGCMPSQRTIAGGPTRECDSLTNTYAKSYNSKLSSEISKLKKTMPGAKFVFIDIYKNLLQIIQNPNKNGFKEVKYGCCGTGTVEIGTTCNMFTPSCKDANDYVFFDAVHPSQKSDKIMADYIFKNNLLDGIF